jgi:hypothetical protein
VTSSTVIEISLYFILKKNVQQKKIDRANLSAAVIITDSNGTYDRLETMGLNPFQLGAILASHNE